jgi:Trp operon repressor
MSNTEGPSEVTRRMRHRRGGSASGLSFSSGSLDDSSVGGGVAASRAYNEEDDNDNDNDNDGYEQEQDAESALPLNAAVQAAAPILRTEAEQAERLRSLQNAEEFTPRTRLNQVGLRSSEYEREYRLGLLHRMLMRNLPLDEIAAQLGVSVSTVMRDRTELTARLREVSKTLDVESLIGNSKGFYEEVQAMAMRAASSSQTPLPMRLAAMRTGLAAHNDMHRFFQAAGVYDVLRFRKGSSEGAQSDIQRLMSLTEDLLTEARRAGVEDPLGDFSGGDSEGMDL